MKKQEEKTYDYTRKHPRHMVIYFDDTLKNYQIVHPTVAFDGNWKALAQTIVGTNSFHKFEVTKGI